MADDIPDVAEVVPGDPGEGGGIVGPQLPPSLRGVPYGSGPEPGGWFNANDPTTVPVATVPPALLGDVIGAQEQKLAADTRDNEFNRARIERRKQEMETDRAATVYAAGNMPAPWNADQERADRIRTPMERFGGAATIFAMVASAFSRQPAISALNAGAAAMNAMREGDELAYKEAHTAWKENSELAIKRFDMQNKIFDQTQKLYDTDLTAWKAESLANAAQYGDTVKLKFLQAGMLPEYFQAQEAQLKAADHMRESVRQEDIVQDYKKKNDMLNDRMHNEAISGHPYTPDMIVAAQALQYGINKADYEKNESKRLEMAARLEYLLANRKPMPEAEAAKVYENAKFTGRADRDKDRLEAMFQAIKKENPDMPDSEAWVRANESVYGTRANARAAAKPLNAEQAFITLWKRDNPKGSADELSAAIAEYKKAGKTPTESTFRAKTMEETAQRLILPTDQGGEGLSEDEAMRKAITMVPKGEGYTMQGQNALTYQTVYEDLKSKNTGMSEADLRLKAKTLVAQSQQVITGNRADDLKSLHDRAGLMTYTIDKVDGLLAKHNALTGIGGSITRPMEIATDWFKGRDGPTDRAQFRRYVMELQEWGTRVLNESRGRPLSTEMRKLDAIIPGLAPGDTTANVVRAYRELQPLLGTIQQQLRERIGGTWTPGSVKENLPETKGGAGAPSWKSAPLKGEKRSALDSDEFQTAGNMPRDLDKRTPPVLPWLPEAEGTYNSPLQEPNLPFWKPIRPGIPGKRLGSQGDSQVG